LKEETKGPLESIRLFAKLNIISAYLGLGPSSAQEAVDYGSALIKELDTPEIFENEDKLELLVSAFSNTAKANINIGDFISAAKQLDRALSIANTNLQHTILLFQYELPQSEKKRRALVEKATQTVIENELKLLSLSQNPLQFNEERLAINLTLLDKHGLTSEFDRLARYIADSVFKKMPVAEALLKLYESITSEEKRLIHIPLLERAMTSYYEEVAEPSLRLKLLQSVSVYSNAPQISTWRNRYLQELEEQVHGGSLFEEDDFVPLLFVASALFRIQAFTKLKKLFQIWRSIEAKALVNNKQLIIMFGYYEMMYLTASKNKLGAKEIAKRLVELTDKVDAGGEHEGLAKLIPDIRASALALLPTPKSPLTRERLSEIGRNQKVTVRYGDSDIQEKKFKLVEKDLREGRCVLVDH
jgi:hypothetical protein